MKLLLLCMFVVGAFCAPKHRISKVTPFSQIVGGTQASNGEFPYQISLQIKRIFGSFQHSCGASIYNEDTIITAAHCVEGQFAEDFMVVAGEHNLERESGHEQSLKVKRIIEHENYSTRSMKNDIALLKLKGQLEYNEFIQPIELAPKGFKPRGKCTVSGWGALSSQGGYPDVLRKVDVPIITDDECRDAYGSRSITDAQVCAGRGGKDSCQGDSGGPLNCEGYLAGVVSYGIGCARPNYPGVYTEVSYYLDWIEDNAY